MNKKRAIFQKKREFIEGGTIGNSKTTFKDYIDEKMTRLKELRTEKRKIQDQVDEIMNQMNKLEDQRQTLQKNLHKDYQKPQEIEKGLAELNNRYKNGGLNNDQEKKTLA